VQSEAPVVLGVCESCNRQFNFTVLDFIEAVWDIKAQFDAHTCKREDLSQAASRIVREVPYGAD
jgi:hypothetical protein